MEMAPTRHSMNDKFLIEEQEKGRKLILKSAWSADIAQFMLASDIRWLELNTVKGWKDTSVEFLREIDWLERLDLIPWGVIEVSAVETLTKLEYLNVGVRWAGSVDFSKLVRLEHCFLDCGKGAETIFECKNLEYLHLHGYKPTPTHDLRQLQKLIVLKIQDSPLNALPELGGAKHLSTLWLRLCPNFANIVSICQCKNLEELFLAGCPKIRSLDDLLCLKKLRKLDLSDNRDMESLKPLEHLRCLEEISFFGSTRIADGDLSPIMRLPNVKQVMFDSRRHYSHRPADFKARARQ
jgi:Leucine-rich repeat (LRR) protein